MYKKVEQKLCLIFAILIVLTGSSCVTHSDLISLNEGEVVVENVPPDSTAQKIKTPLFQAHKIRPNDQLMIHINEFEGNSSSFINKNIATDQGNIRFDFDPPALYFNSYSVNDSGYIKLPMLEKVHVVGLTTSELQDTLDLALKPYVKLSSTKVKLANNRVTLLGEVNNPGVQYLYNERNTLLEAIGLAGDFTQFGNRKKVKLIRQTEDGVKSVYINLQRSDFLTTPYYYVQPNDVVYVEPLKPKSFDNSSRSVGVVLSGISLAVVIVSIFIK